MTRSVTAEHALVGRPFGYEDEVDAAIFLLRAFLRRALGGASGDTRSVDALFLDELLGEFGARGGELVRLGLLGVGITDDDELGAGVVFEAQGHVVADALASIVKAGSGGLGVAAIADLGGLRRRRRLLHVDAGGGIRFVAASVDDGAVDLVAARRNARGIELHLGAAAGHLPAGCRITVGQIQAVRTVGRRGDGRALARHDRAAVRGTGDRRRMMRLFFDFNVGRAGSGAAPPVVYFGGHGVGAGGGARGTPARVGAGALHGAARGGVGVGQRIAVRITGVHMDGDAVARFHKDGSRIRGTGRHRRAVHRRGGPRGAGGADKGAGGG